MTSSSLPVILSAKQVCRELGVSRATLRRMVERGDFGPPLPSGGRALRWHRDALLSYRGEKDTGEDLQAAINKLRYVQLTIDDVIKMLEGE